MATTKTREVPAGRVSELVEAEEERFRKARPRSHELWTEARELLPRGVPSSFQDAAPQPIFMERGKGSRVWDVDGNEYVDFHNGFGVMVVGHAHPKIVEAVRTSPSRSRTTSSSRASCRGGSTSRSGASPTPAPSRRLTPCA